MEVKFLYMTKIVFIGNWQQIPHGMLDATLQKTKIRKETFCKHAESFRQWNKVRNCNKFNE